MDINLTVISGHLSQDPQLKYKVSGEAVCQFNVAVNHRLTDSKGAHDVVSFFGCVAFGRRGEVIAERLRSGDPIFIEGFLFQEKYEEPKTGKKFSKTKVIVNEFHFMGGKSNG